MTTFTVEMYRSDNNVGNVAATHTERTVPEMSHQRLTPDARRAVSAGAGIMVLVGVPITVLSGMADPSLWHPALAMVLGAALSTVGIAESRDGRHPAEPVQEGVDQAIAIGFLLAGVCLVVTGGGFIASAVVVVGAILAVANLFTAYRLEPPASPAAAIPSIRARAARSSSSRWQRSHRT